MRFLVALCALPLAAQTLTGVIDLHVHSDPDSTPRSIDAIGIARLAKERGMRAILLKNHFEPTASMAWLARQQAPGIEVFGGITLNRTIGGINPAAVERMTRVKGGWGRVVWMPTFDAENQVRQSGQQLPFVAITRNGKLLPEVHEVLALIAKHKLTLATGHSAPEESLTLIRAARSLGIDRIIVTHAMKPPVKMSVDQMKQAAKLGAFLEFDYQATIGATKVFDLRDYTPAIRAVGPEHSVLTSDLGQQGFPLHPDGLSAFFRGLRAQGFTEAEINRMAKTNPAKLLGLP